MTLLDRMRAQQCAVVDCARARHEDAAVCRDDLNELWANRLLRQPDGTYLRRRSFSARDFTGKLVAA